MGQGRGFSISSGVRRGWPAERAGGAAFGHEGRSVSRSHARRQLRQCPPPEAFRNTWQGAGVEAMSGGLFFHVAKLSDFLLDPGDGVFD